MVAAEAVAAAMVVVAIVLTASTALCLAIAKACSRTGGALFRIFLSLAVLFSRFPVPHSLFTLSSLSRLNGAQFARQSTFPCGLASYSLKFSKSIASIRVVPELLRLAPALPQFPQRWKHRQEQTKACCKRSLAALTCLASNVYALRPLAVGAFVGWRAVTCGFVSTARMG